jgi:hypothetical protein
LSLPTSAKLQPRVRLAGDIRLRICRDLPGEIDQPFAGRHEYDSVGQAFADVAAFDGHDVILKKWDG